MSNAIGPRDMSRIAKALESIVLELRRMQEPTCRVHGKWSEEDENGLYHCSVCCFGSLYNTNYCPNCGADMRGENE